MIPVCVVFWYLVFGFLYLIYVLCHVLFFHALMCPLIFPVYFPCWISMPSCVSCLLSVSLFSPLAPSVCQPCSLLVYSSVLLPFVITPGFLPRLVISVCVLSLCISLHSSSGHCLYSVFGCPCSCLVCFGFEISMFVLYFAFFFALCWTDLFCYFVLLLRCYFGFCPWFIFPCSLGFFLPSALN